MLIRWLDRLLVVLFDHTAVPFLEHFSPRPTPRPKMNAERLRQMNAHVYRDGSGPFRH